MNHVELRKWLDTLNNLDLIEAEAVVHEARERKKNEGRVTMQRVTADGINVAWFMDDDIDGALRYLLSHVDKGLGEVRTDRVRVPESDVADKLTERWWS